jgi:hypothetical protein
MRGTSTFPVEVTNVSRHGLWLLVGDEELFLPFQHSHGFLTPVSRRFQSLSVRPLTICTGRCSASICLLNRFGLPPIFPWFPGGTHERTHLQDDRVGWLFPHEQ